MIRKKYIAAAIVAVWFLGVDSSWFVHDCPDCGYGKDVTQYRLFAIPVHETIRESLTIAQHVAIDLGVPCMHKNSTKWHKHRWWGLLVCKSPCINGVYRLTARRKRVRTFYGVFLHELSPAPFSSSGGTSQTAFAGQDKKAATTTTATVKIEKQPWPKTLPERMVAVQTALQRHDGPATSKQIAAYYTRASREDIDILLTTLAAVGNIRQLADGRYK